MAAPRTSPVGLVASAAIVSLPTPSRRRRSMLKEPLGAAGRPVVGHGPGVVGAVAGERRRRRDRGEGEGEGEG
jgi:hypothetical protein